MTVWTTASEPELLRSLDRTAAGRPREVFPGTWNVGAAGNGWAADRSRERAAEGFPRVVRSGRTNGDGGGLAAGNGELADLDFLAAAWPRVVRSGIANGAGGGLAGEPGLLRSLALLAGGWARTVPGW